MDTLATMEALVSQPLRIKAGAGSVLALKAGPEKHVSLVVVASTEEI